MSFYVKVKETVRKVAPGFAYNYLKRIKRYIDNVTFTSKIVCHTFGGVPLTVSIEDHIGCSWYDCDWPELREFELLRSRKLQIGATVFEVGAHQGIVAMMLAKIVGPTGRVIAVEADRRCAEIARKNLALNDITNVELVQAAVAAITGEVSFAEGSHIARGERGQDTQMVNAVTVDDLRKEFGIPDVLFIDVEGYECQVLHGAQETLRNRPDLFVEIHVGVGLE
jgi:FkbM family methyltransferase